MSTSFEYGLNAAAKEYDGTNKYIRITDIDDDSREFSQEDVTSPDTDLSKAEGYKLSEGDILFARTGASVGKSYIYRISDGLVYYAGFLIRAKIKPEYNPEFVFQNTLTSDYEKFIKVTSMRSGQPGVNAQEYSQFEINVPSKPEQDKIATYFRNLDNLITLQQRKYDKLVNVKKSMLEKMFPREGAKVPEIRFEGFTDDWEQRKLGECFTERKDSMPEGELISVTIGEGIKKFSELGRHDNSNDDKSKYKKVCVGDIAYNSMRMWQGASGYSPYEGIVSPAYTVLSPITDVVDSKCISYLFKRSDMTHVFQINSQGITSDNWNLKYPALSEIEIMVSPYLAEQHKIAAYLSRIDNLITLQQRERV
jgi:type I restriction enzyme S subunit